ncbi:TetR/AcrR family transcriptional regulator [Trinickia terrae]|uniref:TetR/AcrR family transcriptional regulator n=2 Tax=Trinickia terrae TaxID=2571161 RepID=A0A4U1IGI6_9BURK|nr:TetR/AcrR family transcriptional regulator [Trinickia terrae]
MPRTQSISLPAKQRPRRSDADPSAKSLTVLNAARKIFLTHGFSAATTDMIQREAGVSKSTVYAHYPSKEALFVAVIEAECSASTGAIRGITFHPGKLEETLTAVARAYLSVILSPSALALFRVVIAEAPTFPNLARAFYLAGPHLIQSMVAEYLASAAAAGEVDLSVLGRDTAAAHFVNLVRSEPHMQCLTHPTATPSAAQVDQWIATVVTTFVRAYGAPIA